MVFPVAGIEVHPLVPPLVAFVISFFTSMGGVSGAFLLLPFQVSVLGFTSPSVSSTNQVFNIVAIPSGVYRYLQEGRMVWPLTWIVIIGTLPGVLIGAIVRVQYLPDPKISNSLSALSCSISGEGCSRISFSRKKRQGFLQRNNGFISSKNSLQPKILPLVQGNNSPGLWSNSGLLAVSFMNSVARPSP